MAHPIAILVSGGGRSLENLADEVAAGRLDAEVRVVISDRPGVFALERAAKLGIETLVLDRSEFDSHEAYSQAVFAELEARGVELAVLAGFLRLLLLQPGWAGRVINIHPSLLPAFGGKGYYGEHVHRAVLARGVQVTGCTVHYVDDEYDNGKVILQRWIPVPDGIDVEGLATLVFEQEKLALPEAIRRHFAAIKGLPSPTA
ncbi:MAG: phosphoribosylglycinamide formyltransferase [Planctomycetota bacterium]|nr:phosphoribosylglycinamide formyltransferase [Planctomycetota bacterium]